MDAAKAFLAATPVTASKTHANLEFLRTSSTGYDALQSLAKSNVLSEPVLDLDNEYYGALSCNDLLRTLIDMLDEEYPQWIESAGDLTADDMAWLGRTFCATPVEKMQHAGELWLLEASDSSSMLDVLTQSLRVQEAAVHHRVFLCTPAHGQPIRRSLDNRVTSIAIKPGSERRAATGLAVSGMVTQSDVVQLLYDNRDKLGGVTASTVEQLELDGGAVFTVKASTPALVAFGYMARDHKSCLGVTEDSTGKLVGNLSASDLRGLEEEDFALLLLPVADYLLVHAGKGGKAKAEVLAGERVPDAVAALTAELPAVAVTLGTTLEQVLELLTQRHLHRLYVVDAAGAPVSIITLTDVLRLLTK